MIQTNWCVITGGPSSGKTTLIEELSAREYLTVPEVAREYIKQLLAENHTLEDIRHDTRNLQRGILAIALKRERTLQPEQLTFFDRGTPDSLGYFSYYNLDSDHVRHSCEHMRYKKIFYCHQLPVEYDSIRVEDQASAKKIGECIYSAYQNLGYDLIELPAVPVAERIHLILNAL